MQAGEKGGGRGGGYVRPCSNTVLYVYSGCGSARCSKCAVVKFLARASPPADPPYLSPIRSPRSSPGLFHTSTPLLLWLFGSPPSPKRANSSQERETTKRRRRLLLPLPSPLFPALPLLLVFPDSLPPRTTCFSLCNCLTVLCLPPLPLPGKIARPQKHLKSFELRIYFVRGNEGRNG